jgi:hypothetical protein
MIPPLLRDRVFRRYWGASTVSMFGDQVCGVALPLAAVLALHALTLAQLLVVTFVAGGLSVLFNVSNGTLFVSIVPPERYMDAQSLIYGSRALSFVGGPSAGGVLVQMLSAPFAIVADALSFVGSAFFLRQIRPAEPPADDSAGSMLAGARFIARSALVRASLAVAAAPSG